MQHHWRTSGLSLRARIAITSLRVSIIVSLIIKAVFMWIRIAIALAYCSNLHGVSEIKAVDIKATCIYFDKMKSYLVFYYDADAQDLCLSRIDVTWCDSTQDV